MRWMSKSKFASKEIEAVMNEWLHKKEMVKFMSYEFALRNFASQNTKNDELAVAIGAAAYSILTGQWFDRNWHDILTRTCEEGYEAGFLVRDIITDYLTPEQFKEVYK